MTSILNDIFDEIWVINLKSRPDKLKFITDNLTRHNIYFKIFNAVTPLDVSEGKYQYLREEIDKYNKGNPNADGYGIAGCSLSHREILQDCLLRQVHTVLILEDDAQFVGDFNEQFKIYYEQLPPDWNLLWLGYNKNKSLLYHNNLVTYTPINQYWEKFDYVSGATAIGYKKEIIPLVLSKSAENIGKEQFDLNLSIIGKLNLHPIVRMYSPTVELIYPVMIGKSDTGIGKGLWFQYANKK